MKKCEHCGSNEARITGFCSVLCQILDNPPKEVIKSVLDVIVKSDKYDVVTNYMYYGEALYIGLDDTEKIAESLLDREEN